MAGRSELPGSLLTHATPEPKVAPASGGPLATVIARVALDIATRKAGGW